MQVEEIQPAFFITQLRLFIILKTTDSLKSAIIFIHGFCSNSKSWNKMNRLISQDNVFKNVRIDFFNYPTGILKFNATNKLLSRIASLGSVQLLSSGGNFSITELAFQLRSRIENEFNDCEDIILVGHSMGGVIARKYLLDHSCSRISKLILFAAPVSGTRFATFLSSVLKTNYQLTDLKKNSELFMNLNSDWWKSDKIKKTKVINIVTPFDQYVSIAELKEYWKPDCDEYYLLKNKIHFSINSPRNTSDQAYKVLRNCILKET